MNHSLNFSIKYSSVNYANNDFGNLPKNLIYITFDLTLKNVAKQKIIYSMLHRQGAVVFLNSYTLLYFWCTRFRSFANSFTILFRPLDLEHIYQLSWGTTLYLLSQCQTIESIFVIITTKALHLTFIIKAIYFYRYKHSYMWAQLPWLQVGVRQPSPTLIADIVAMKLAENALIFLVSLHIDFTINFLNRCRVNAISGVQVGT